MQKELTLIDKREHISTKRKHVHHIHQESLFFTSGGRFFKYLSSVGICKDACLISKFTLKIHTI